MSEPALGVKRAMARYGWYVRGIWRGFIVVYAALCTARIVPPEQSLVYLLYREGL